MPTQTATTGNLEYGSNVMIGEARYTAEFNSPNIHLVERHTLGHGEKTYRFLKFGQATFSSLTDGQDMVSSQDLGMTYVDASPSEVGAKFVITDKLARELKPDAFAIAGGMLGDGMGRKRDEDIIALYASLDNAEGATTKYLSLTNAASCVSNARGYKFPNPVYAVHHPNALGYLAKGTMAIGATYYAGLLDETTRKILNNFWRGIVINQVPFFDDGNIKVISGDTTGYGAIFSKNAMGVVESKAPYVARERDESLRATEVNMIADYIAVEIDGTYGSSMRYMISVLASNA